MFIMNYYKHVLYIVVTPLLLLASPMLVYAVSVGANVTLQTTGGADISLLSGGDFDSMTVNSNGFTFTLSGTQVVTLRDSDSQVLKTNIDGLQGSCSSGNSEITLSASKGSSITLIIEGFACSGGGGGGGSYSSGGGGGSTSSSDTTTTQTTTTTTTTTTTPAPTTQAATSPYLEGAPPPVAPLSSGTTAPISTVAFPGISQLSRRLSVGSSGEDVRALQEALASMPDVYPEGIMSGYFGALTKAAVAEFQMKYGIVSSSSDAGYGSVGPMTRAKLQEVFAIGTSNVVPPQVAPSAPATTALLLTHEISLGATGDDVTQLQAFLAADPSLYPEGKVTGYYGSLTVAAVRRFQAKYGISQVGRVGPQTMAKLNELMGGSAPAAPSTPSSSSTGGDDAAARAALQKQINDLQALLQSLTQQVQSAQ